MKNKINALDLFGWIFAITVMIVGILNIIWIHPVPGIVYLLLSLVFLPPANAKLSESFGFSIPLLVKIILGIVIILFTLGVSDLGDMIDKL